MKRYVKFNNLNKYPDGGITPAMSKSFQQFVTAHPNVEQQYYAPKPLVNTNPIKKPITDVRKYKGQNESQLLKHVVQLVDPTGISSYGDIADTFSDPKSTTADKVEAVISGIPVLGRLTKIKKGIKLIQGAVDVNQIDGDLPLVPQTQLAKGGNINTNTNMKRYVKMRKYADGDWLNAKQQNQQSQLAPVYGAIGNTANTFLQPNAGENGFVDWNNQSNVNKSIGGETLQYAGQGAALGANPALLAATGGLSAPIGAVIGAGVGFFKGKSDADKNKGLYNRYLQGQQTAMKAQGIQNYQSNLQQGFEPMGNVAQSKTGFKKGGVINPKKNSQQTGGSQTSFADGGDMLDDNKPIYVNNSNDPRLRAYNDSNDLYKTNINIPRIYPNLPQTTKENFDLLNKKSDNLTRYGFDEQKASQDKKLNKIKSFNDYVYTTNNKDYYNHPIFLKNNKKELDKYSNNVEDFEQKLPNGDFKTPMSVYDGKPDFRDYTLTSKDLTSSRGFFDGKLGNIYHSKIKPIKTNYYGEDKLQDSGDITNTQTINKRLIENNKYKNYHIPTETKDEYKQPVQPYLVNGIKAKQQELVKAGLLKENQVDGIWGKGSESAWNSYQESLKPKVVTSQTSTTPSTTPTNTTPVVNTAPVNNTTQTIPTTPQARPAYNPNYDQDYRAERLKERQAQSTAYGEAKKANPNLTLAEFQRTYTAPSKLPKYGKAAIPTSVPNKLNSYIPTFAKGGYINQNNWLDRY